MKVFFPIALFVPLLSDSGGVSAQTCSDLTAASVSSLGTFSEVNLLLCGSSTSTSTVVKSPNALNWIVSEGSALAISMTPADFVIPIVKNGALYFDYNSESTWSGSGDVGWVSFLPSRRAYILPFFLTYGVHFLSYLASIEITLPEGQVTRYSVVESKWGIQFTLSSPVTIDVTGDYNTIYATSTAAVTLDVTGDYSTAQIDASGGGLLDVTGDSNTLEFKGAVSQASIVGDSNSILVEGAITGSSIEFVGDNNAFTLNGGSCDGADFTGYVDIVLLFMLH